MSTMMKMGHCLHKTRVPVSGKKTWQGPSKNLRQYLDLGSDRGRKRKEVDSCREVDRRQLS